MAFDKITSSDLQNKGVIGLADTPGLTTTAMQQKFDEIALDVIVPKFNALIDDIEDAGLDPSTGDVMHRSVYDTDNDGIVDNAEKVNNHTVLCDVPEDAVFTDTVYDDTEIREEIAEKADADDIPTKTSDLNNDSGFITSASVPTKTSELTNDSGFITSSSVPTKTSQLTNDSGFITSSAVPTKTSQLTNDSGFITASSVPSDIDDLSDVSISSPSNGQVLGYNSSTQKWENSSAGTGDMQKSVYDSDNAVATAGGIKSYVTSAIPDVTGKADKVSSATNGNFAGLDSNGNLTDSGSKASDFLTQHQDISGKMNTSGNNSASEVKFSGSFTVGTRLPLETVGTNSVAEGTNNTASGNYSHAEGTGCTASAPFSHAEGSGTTASGNGSHAEGSETTAYGSLSHVSGYANIANEEFQFVTGKYNDNKATTYFEIGNGTANNARNNAFEVYSDGKISQDNGTTKFKFTRYNNEDGYYDASGTFHAFSSGGGGSSTLAGLDDVSIASQSDGQVLAYNSSSSKWKNASLATVATSGSYTDLSNKPTIPQGDMEASDYDPNGTVATAGGIVAYIDATITAALTASY